jgi:hypothetical protein
MPSQGSGGGGVVLLIGIESGKQPAAVDQDQ